jgi:hypothetical protein
MSARVTGTGVGAAAVAGGRCQTGEAAVEVACQAVELWAAAAINTRKNATCAKRLQKFDPVIRWFSRGCKRLLPTKK